MTPAPIDDAGTFTEETASKIASDYLLGPSTVKVWRSRRKIPLKYMTQTCLIELTTGKGKTEVRPLFCWRTRLNIDQPTIADNLGKSVATVCQWETGTRTPTPDNYDKLTKFIQSIFNQSNPSTK